MIASSPLSLRSGHYSIRIHLASLLTIGLLLTALMGVIFFALTTGSEAIPLHSVLAYLHLETPNTSTTNLSHLLILDAFRAPRIALAVCCGAMLACSGAVMQSLTRNGLADPSILGVREGAALCVVALILTAPGLSLAWRPLVGMIGGLASGVFVLLLARGSSSIRFVMIGISLSWFLSAAMMVLLAATDTKDLQTVLIWIAGSLQGATWQSVQLVAILFAICLIALLFNAPSADIEALGDALSTSLGVRRKWVNIIRFSVAIFLVAGSVSVAGSIGFVGLIAPHLARFLPNYSSRYHLISTSLIGAILVLAADTLGRAAFAPVELPTGVVIAVIGAPTLIILLWTRRNQL
ncbi:FecCD family ABC transporter permease [Marinomonas sp.]|uniref:FecCD family ABC transporter permease n=2 Tax=unclassified Marinomonas TaxID=196814 RepID=UPI003C72D0DE